MAQVKCWEFHKCPQERRDSCSAYIQNAGRTCWLVAGTLCGGVVQSEYAKSIGGCRNCEFYLQVTARRL